MNSESLPVAAVVVTHNNADTVLECIESVLENGVQNIVVVDNASEDKTVSQLESQPVHVIENEHNTGFAAAINKGVQFLQEKDFANEWLLFLNPDARLSRESLSKAIAYIQARPRIGIGGLVLVDERGQMEPFSYGEDITLISLIKRQLFGNQKIRRVDWVSGGAMLVKTHVFQETGGFDESFFLYWEDIDFCKRVRTAGYEVVRIPRAEVVHQRGHSLGDQRQKAQLYDQSADRYFQKHYSRSIWYFHRLLRRWYRWWRPQAL